jgi:hypothetical protein
MAAQNNHGRFDPSLAKLSENLHSGHTWHDKVEDDHVVSSVTRASQTVDAVSGGLDMTA